MFLSVLKLRTYLTLIIILTLTFKFSLAQKARDGRPEDVSSLCRQQKKCGRCNQVKGCLWCRDEKFITKQNPGFSRCDTPGGHAIAGCTEFEKNGLPSARADGWSRGEVSPTKYDVKLYPNQKISITFTYRDAGNKPLDLYYLMDLSQTMAKHKPAVISLGRTFAEAVQSQTKDLQLGFGSFVDKPLMPFAARTHIYSTQYRPVYGFENALKLTLVDPTQPLFQRKVKEAQISVNLDPPEGTLDAMMQVLECWDKINWRSHAHRLLVVSTDGSFHIAGDGKLGGVVLPNDGRCHLDEKGLYTHSTVTDYPSVAQILAKIREKKIHVIFAVTENVAPLYQTLGSLLTEYVSTIQLKSGSGKVGLLVQEQYEKIRTTVELSSSPTLKESELGVTYYAKCSPQGSFQKGSKCTNLPSNAVVEFKVEFELRRCPAEHDDGKWVQALNITPTGSEQSLQVILNLQCGCDCEGSSDPVLKNEKCNSRGAIVCGICNCDKGFSGNRCQCDGTLSSFEDENKCSCGRHGVCKCGQCECDEHYSGNSCECDERECPCTPESHGICDCQKCSCDAGWSGPACTCSTAKDGCKKAGEKDVCSTRGDCLCNRCTCNPGFVGKFCDVCHNCKCLDHVALCAVERENKTHVRLPTNNGTAEDRSDGSCALPFPSDVSITTYPNTSQLMADEKKCYPDFDGCNLEYIYGYNKFDQQIKIRIRTTLDCPLPLRPTNPLPIIFMTITSVVLIGILTLLLWKIITYLMDRREFNKFENECQERRWGTAANPLYKEATSTFQNPAYTD